jgi:hypothetical protein
MFNRKSFLIYVVSTNDASIENIYDVTPGMTICRGTKKCQVVNQAVHSATRQGGGPHGQYKMCTSIRGTSTKVEHIRPEIDPASRRVNCSRSLGNGNTFTHKGGNAREMDSKMQKGAPATGRILVTKTTVKLPAAT